MVNQNKQNTDNNRRFERSADHIYSRRRIPPSFHRIGSNPKKVREGGKDRRRPGVLLRNSTFYQKAASPYIGRNEHRGRETGIDIG